MNRTLVVAIWLVLLAFALPYVRRVKHPEVKPLAALMMFAMIFSVGSAALFVALTWIALATGLAAGLAHPLGALLFLALVFIPPFVLGRLVIGRPPLNRPLPR
ncbi:MAG: hypothetical protein ACM3KD_11770 [Hyphomicrobiaceae bacterium]